METPNLTTHLNYLTDSAHLLAKTAPEISAHLSTCRNQLLLANDIPLSDVQKQHVCGACGHIMILGRESMLKVENQRWARSTKKHRRAANKTMNQQKGESIPLGPEKKVSCGYCGRYTRVNLPAPSPISRKKKKLQTSSKAPAVPSHAAPPQKQSANASSKKRAKNRKAGLQAMLEQSQANKNSARKGLGLSLADFMANSR